MKSCFRAPLLALLLLGAAPRQQQPRIATISAATCANCRIVAESAAFLGHPSDTITLNVAVNPARDSRGRFYATAPGAARIAHLFDQRGRLIRSFGRPGQGPGEFSTIVTEIQVGPGDTLYLFERGRGHVFSPDLEFVRQLPIAIPQSGRSAGTVLGNGTILRPSGPQEFTLFNANGGRSAPPVTLQVADSNACTRCGGRVFIPGTQPGSVWSMPSNYYALEQHDLSGRLLVRLERRVSWFPTWMAPPGATSDQPAEILAQLKRARLFGFYRAADGLLWAYIFAPDEAVPIPANFDIRPLAASEQTVFFARHFATYVEVFDPARGQLVATLKHKGRLLPIGDGYAAHLMLDTDSGNAFKVMRMRLVR